MRQRRNWYGVFAALAVALPLSPALAADDFTLRSAIPSDVFLSVNARSHEGQAWLETQMQRLWKEVEAARFDREFKRMFKAIAAKGGTAPETFDEQWQKMTDLCTAVDWSGLAAREYAMGMRLGFPTVEFVNLFLPAAGKSNETFDALSGMAKTLVAMAGEDLKLDTEESGDIVIHRITVAGAPFPVGFALGRHKDVIFFAFGPQIAEQTLALLRGGPDAKPLASTPRYQSAFKTLPAGKDAAVFVDIAKLMTQVRDLWGKVQPMLAEHAPPPDSPDRAVYEKAMKIPGKLLDAIDMFEYSATVSTTDGMKSTEQSSTLLRDDAKTHALYSVIFGNPPLADPYKFIPGKATAFAAGNGVNLGALWRWGVEFMKNDVPEGEEAITALAAAEAEIGLSIEQDVLSWIDGGYSTFEVAGPTPASPGLFAWMLRVKDEAKAREMLERLVAMAKPALGQNGTLDDAEIEGAPGFLILNSPQLMMFGGGIKPTFGVKDGWLFIAGNAASVTLALETASGKGENITRNERFKKEGIAPASGAVSVSYTDLTQLGEQLGQVLAMAPMVAMFAPDIGKDPVASSVLTMIGKVGRVVRKLDFLQSSASQTTFDGKVLIGRSVTNYREPPPPPKIGSESDEPTPEKKSE